MLWHGREASRVLEEPVRTRSVVLLAACLRDRAAEAGLEGPEVARVQLGQAAMVLDRYPVSALEACRTVPAAEGGDLVDELLADYGTSAFEEVRRTVRQALDRHRADGGPHVRIADRRAALRGAGTHPYTQH
ncbi:hypothetical protein [Streptomyces sp. NPDC059604]|uniref:hypothetical protein n=1 Tax=Streptomyces sp. NPDC059604 TaxID=3346881 RepID=UPI00367D95D8